MVLLLSLVDIPFARIFRIATWAFFGLLYGLAIRTGWLAFMDPAKISAHVLSLTPGAVSNLMDPSRYQSPLYTLMSMINVFELAWCGIMYWGLVSSGKLSRFYSVVIVAVVWAGLTLFQWAIVLYLSGVNS
jgi:hypothetical protein